MTLALSLVIPDKALQLVSAHLMRLDVVNEMEKKRLLLYYLAVFTGLKCPSFYLL